MGNPHAQAGFLSLVLAPLAGVLKPARVRLGKAHSPGTPDEHFGAKWLLLEGLLELQLSLGFAVSPTEKPLTNYF